MFEATRCGTRRPLKVLQLHVSAKVSGVVNVVCFGECMIELSRGADGVARVSYGGDTLNTAIYLARLGVPTAYMTALGADAWSANLTADWAREGIDVSLVTIHPDRAPGIYAISTDSHGERSFTYWRDQSAARAFFETEGATKAIAAAKAADLLYLSGITLALFPAAERSHVIRLAHEVRGHGGRVAFDPNYRPRLWPCKNDLQQAIRDLAPALSIALPSFDDEQSLWGDANLEVTAARWTSLGVAEVVVKNGASGALTSAGLVRGPVVDTPTDTTGAGDSFNAGYLAARMRGASAEAAAIQGAKLAACVIQHSGAIVPRSVMPAAD